MSDELQQELDQLNKRMAEVKYEREKPTRRFRNGLIAILVCIPVGVLLSILSLTIANPNINGQGLMNISGCLMILGMAGVLSAFFNGIQSWSKFNQLKKLERQMHEIKAQLKET